MRTTTIDRERRRIEAAFHVALFAASSVAVVSACGSNGDGSRTTMDASLVGVDASSDATVLGDAGGMIVADGGGAADGEATTDAPNCAPTFFILDGATLSELDAMPDADLCDLVEPCGLPQGLAAQGCLVIETQSDGTPIPDSGFGCNFTVGHGCVNGAYVPPPGPAAELTCACELFIQGGRRTGGARRRSEVRAAPPLGAFFADMAREEAASVAEFERLASELATHGAPAHLVRAASRAARDEVRHAASMANLAAAHGGAVRPGRRSRARATRSLEVVARENATEGCVRETFAALLASWQAEHAEDRAVRTAFRRIARDETRHAALAWSVAAWADSRLDARGRSRVARARTVAIQAVASALTNEQSPEITRGAGVPRPAEARILFQRMTRALGA